MKDGAHLHHTSQTIKSLSLWERGGPKALEVTPRYFTLPNLTALNISKSYWNSSTRVWNERAVADFLTRSACSLTSLYLSEVPLRDRQVITLLELTPTLTIFKIDEYRDMPPGDWLITGMFLRRFVVVHEPESLLSSRTFPSRLADVALRVTQKDGLVEKDFFDMVSTRWLPDADQAKKFGVDCLRSVRITIEANGDSNSTVGGHGLSLDSLECFRDAGLRLDIYQIIP
ncbi:hypothetical protein AAF712_006859 [Marasmius tenuissimus]|uniref:Uncharacterized protein n=1 Tax=Marasmius tenuissimus TaxID=585030 RepID=A0ABR2ZY75_9AGAR